MAKEVILITNFQKTVRTFLDIYIANAKEYFAQTLNYLYIEVKPFDTKVICVNIDVVNVITVFLATQFFLSGIGIKNIFTNIIFVFSKNQV